MMAELKGDTIRPDITVRTAKRKVHIAAVSRPSGIVILCPTNQIPSVSARIRMMSEKAIIMFRERANTSRCFSLFPVPCSNVRNLLMADENDPVTSANMEANPATALLMP